MKGGKSSAIVFTHSSAPDSKSGIHVIVYGSEFGILTKGVKFPVGLLNT